MESYKLKCLNAIPKGGSYKFVFCNLVGKKVGIYRGLACAIAQVFFVPGVLHYGNLQAMHLWLMLHRNIFITILCLLALLATLFTCFSNEPGTSNKSLVALLKVEEKKPVYNYRHKLDTRVPALKKFCRDNNYSTQYCFMVDMSIHSGKKRFFVYNLKKSSVECEGLVTNGAGSETGSEKLLFSNVPGSGCTSLGRYKIGNSYNGRFGLAYKLHGLNKTNSKAFERYVVLHSHSCVPEDDIYPGSICPSLGCPTVAPEFLTTLSNYISKSGKPVLLEIYE